MKKFLVITALLAALIGALFIPIGKPEVGSYGPFQAGWRVPYARGA